MRAAHTVEQVRKAEAALMATAPEGSLMQRAATGLATAVVDLVGGGYGRRVLLLVGSGDNAGDALYAGARLARRGAHVEAVLVGASTHESGLRALRDAGGRVVPLSQISAPDVVVDGIVGIGGRPGLRQPALDAIRAVHGVPMVAVDVPSGVDVDTGRLDGSHVTADLTVTFGTHKICHLVAPASAACGVVHLVDIGLVLPDAAVAALQADDVAALLPMPGDSAQKYTRGVVGIRAGSARYPGAAALSTSGAACGIAGMVRYVGPDAVADVVRSRHPEVVAGEGQVQAWVVGSGGDADAAEALSAATADGVPVVIDADALRAVTGPLDVPALLTPHAGELAALLGVAREEVEADQLESARRAARTFGATVLLKGPRTLVAAANGRVRVNSTGTPWLAVAGAGDVLGGLCGALLAAGLTPYDAGSVGAWLHGAAATVASDGGPISATAVADALPTVIAALLG